MLCFVKYYFIFLAVDAKEKKAEFVRYFIYIIKKYFNYLALKEEGKKAEILKKLIDELQNCKRLLVQWVFIHMSHIIQRVSFFLKVLRLSYSEENFMRY